MKFLDTPSVARSLLLTGLLLAPGVVAVALELRHGLPDESLTTALATAQEDRRKLSRIEDRLKALDEAKSTLNERIDVIARLKRAQSDPAEALAEAGRRIPRGFAVSEISCTRDTVGNADDWVVTIHGDPTDAGAATWAGGQGRMLAAGHVVEMRLPIDHRSGLVKPKSTSPWW